MARQPQTHDGAVLLLSTSEKCASWVAATIIATSCIYLRLPLGFSLAVTALSLTVPLVAHWEDWRLRRTYLGGIFALYPAIYIFAYVLGSVQLGTRGVLGVDPGPAQWAYYVLGLLGFVLGAALFRSHRAFAAASWEARSIWLACIIGTGGLAIAVVNFATGGVPALAESVNLARFAPNEAVAGKLTGIAVGAQQFTLVILSLHLALTIRKRARPNILLIAFASIITISLLAQGSRTFITLPFIAVVIALMEVRTLRVVVAASLSGLIFIGLVGFNELRQEKSDTELELANSLEQNGLAKYPFSSGLLSLQIGPRVFELSRRQIPETTPFQHGDFFLADGSIFLPSSSPASDYFTTTNITRRDYSAVGGSPPTVVGGLYIDGGWPIVAIGMLILGAATRVLRDTFLRKPTVYSAAAYGYWSAWMLQSIYNYVSLKPAVVTFLLCSALCAAISVSARRNQTTSNESTPPVGDRIMTL